MSAAPVTRVAFGSCQDRKLFPLHYAPDRLGNQMARQDAPHIGPGCYDSHQFGTMIYELEKTPSSRRGYCVYSAARFQSCGKTVTPSPQQHQQDQTQTRLPPQNKAPFNSNTPRFKEEPETAYIRPGPLSYTPSTATNRKVQWPGCFGRPDWSRLPQNESLMTSKGQLEEKAKFVRHRGRVAYLSLYF
ncbi:ciliary microtubule-associated protein 3 [Aulostomus maculatus]